MKVDNIVSTQQRLVERHQRQGRQLLESVTRDMTYHQRAVVENVYRAFAPLVEASLTADNINQIFKDVEAHPSNRNALGKTVDATVKVGGTVKDAASAVNDAVNKFGGYLQNTKPVEYFDDKFEQLKNTINKKFPDSKILDAVSSMGAWARENPGKTAAVIGLLTTIASVAATPVGGAIAGQILRGSVELLKGEKLSTAVGKGLKTAAYSWLAGKSIELIGDALKGGMAFVTDKMYPGAVKIKLGAMGQDLGIPEIDADAVTYATPQDAAALKRAYDTGYNAYLSNDMDTARKAFTKAAEIVKSTDTDEYMNALAINQVDREAMQNVFKGANYMFKGLAAAAQGAVAGVMSRGSNKKESRESSGQALTEQQINLVLAHVLSEGPLDALKAAAAKIGQGASALGKKLTTKLSAGQLAKAYDQAGSPTDSNALAAFLQKQGADLRVVDDIYKNAGIPLTDVNSEEYKTFAGSGQVEPTLEPEAEPETTGGDVTGAKPSAEKPEIDGVEKPGTPGWVRKPKPAAAGGEEPDATAEPDAEEPAPGAPAAAIGDFDKESQAVIKQIAASYSKMNAIDRDEVLTYLQQTLRANPPKSSTGGTVTKTASGVRHTASTQQRVKQAQPAAAQTATPPKAAADAFSGMAGQLSK